MSETVAKTDQIIAVIPEDLQAEVFTDSDKIDAFIDQMTKVVESHTPDISTAAGRDEIISLAHSVSKAKVKLDNHGKTITEDWRKKTKVINDARKHITTRLDALRKKARAPVTEWEQEKFAKDAEIKGRIDQFKSYIDPVATRAAVILENLKLVEAIEIDESFGDLRDDAYAIHCKVVKALDAALKDAQQREAEQVELEALRAEKAKRDAEDEKRRAKEAAAKAEIEKIERERKEQEAAALKAKQDAEAEAERLKQAAEDARLKAEAEAKAKLERAKRDAEAKLQAEKDKAAKAEADRLAAIAAEEAAQRKRDENQAHRNKIDSTAAKALMAGADIDKGTANAIVTLIVSGGVPNISIKY